MKKKFLLSLIIVPVLIAAGVVSLFLIPRGGHVRGQPSEVAEEGEWTYMYSENTDTCTVTAWQWDGDESNMTIEVPEELGGRAVTSLSSFNWTIGRFEVRLPDDMSISGDGAFCTEDEACVPAEDDYVIYHFDIIVGPNITDSAVVDTWVGYIVDSGSDEDYDVVYKLEYTVTQR